MNDWRDSISRKSGWLIGIAGLLAWLGLLWGMFGDVL
jgi:hypothetical protein